MSDWLWIEQVLIKRLFFTKMYSLLPFCTWKSAIEWSLLTSWQFPFITSFCSSCDFYINLWFYSVSWPVINISIYLENIVELSQWIMLTNGRNNCTTNFDSVLLFCKVFEIFSPCVVPLLIVYVFVSHTNHFSKIKNMHVLWYYSLSQWVLNNQ